MEEKGPKFNSCMLLENAQVFEDMTYPLLTVYSFCLYFQGTYLKLSIILAIWFLR